jgi:hypothetical protein
MASEVRGDSTTVSFIRASYERDEFTCEFFAFDVEGNHNLQQM